MTTFEHYRARIVSEETLESQLPVTLSNGLSVGEVECRCPDCGLSSPSEFSRGKITESFGTVMFDVISICKPCNQLFQTIGRVKPEGDTMRVESIIDNNWSFYTLKSETKTDKAKRLLSKITGFFCCKNNS